LLITRIHGNVFRNELVSKNPSLRKRVCHSFLSNGYTRQNTYERELTRSVGKNPSAHTLTHSCLQTRYRKKRVLTYEKLEDILARLQIIPLKSLRRLSQETGVPVGSNTKAAKLIKFRPYRVGVVHELKITDAP
jgi:predicted transcriptional regulator with HTH domain